MSRFAVETVEGSRVPLGYGGHKGFCERTRRKRCLRAEGLGNDAYTGCKTRCFTSVMNPPKGW
jgi:hypothetical protein